MPVLVPGVQFEKWRLLTKISVRSFSGSFSAADYAPSRMARPPSKWVPGLKPKCCPDSVPGSGRRPRLVRVPGRLPPGSAWRKWRCKNRQNRPGPATARAPCRESSGASSGAHPCALGGLAQGKGFYRLIKLFFRHIFRGIAHNCRIRKAKGRGRYRPRPGSTSLAVDKPHGIYSLNSPSFFFTAMFLRRTYCGMPSL